MSLRSSLSCYMCGASLLSATKTLLVPQRFSSSLNYSVSTANRTSFPLRASNFSSALLEKIEPLNLTYLEANTWVLEVGGLNILVDPILVGNVDFGWPWAFDTAKKTLKDFRLEDLPEVDCLIISQSYDDHCHLRTLKPLSERRPDLPVVSTPNAEPLLQPIFTNVTYLEPGQKHQVRGVNGVNVYITATAGPVLGPPWQRPENGYIIESDRSPFTLYYEPHCVYNLSFLQNYKADVVITPVVKQELPWLTLVSGQEDAVKLAKLLQAKFVIPMNNGNLDKKGFLARFLRNVGTVESFKDLLSKELPDTLVLEPTPGVPLQVAISSIVV